MAYNLLLIEDKCFINGVLINEDIFQEEKSEFKPILREEKIDDLINWISETKSETDKVLMKDDLKYLIKLKDEFIFSSISTNKYVAKSNNLKEFNRICKEILKLNEVLK